MILRRITQHLKDQNWFAVALDFVIVVLGILIAFQITNWNEAQQNDVQAQRFLERLEQDFIQHLEQVDRGLILHKQSIVASSRLTNGIQIGVLDQNHLIADIDSITNISTPPGPSSAFQELVSSGKTDLIRSESLRNDLYSYNSNISFLRATYMTLTTPINNTQTALMPAMKMQITETPSLDFEQHGRPTSIDSSVLLNNTELLNSLKATYLIHDNIHLLLKRTHAVIKNILASIKAEKEKTQ
ncbi:DUF6090 family protein [Paraglaciecola hydrolytica]|uniref:Uncharacterized protein n=1 Tax=Paraglaciecola hydrolytica TaxID=1799789 RepID=A0A148KKY0_9ALTE|nr:DUF6090 family protein [Paraglaciecola hydrolytica]KXI26921.1 hypothetical protein AX660_02685 [Paraglaciecola hydrolytica]